MHTFVAIDFETAQKRRASPIQVGVVRVIDGVIGTPFVRPVMPPAEYRWFDPELTPIHGLSPEYIQGAEEWPAILDRIQRFIIGPDGQPMTLVAHNASFERSVIQKTSEATGVHDPRFSYICTVKLGRAVDQHSPNHKLNTLAARYGIEQLNHHDAGDDALVGARVMLHLMSMSGAADAVRRSQLR